MEKLRSVFTAMSMRATMAVAMQAGYVLTGILPAAPLVTIIVILARSRLTRSASNKKLKANTHSILKGSQ